MILIILAALLQSEVFFVPAGCIESSDGVLGVALKQVFQQTAGWVYVLGLLFFLADLFLVHKIANMHKMLGVYSFAAALIFAWLHVFFVAFAGNISTCAAVFLLLLFVYFYTKLFDRNFSYKTSFNMGLVVGSGVLLYKPFLVFILLSLWGSIAYRTDFIKVIGTILVGFVVPFYFLITIYYLSDLPVPWTDLLPMPRGLYLDYSKYGTSYFFYVFLFGFLWLQGFLKVQGSLPSMLIFNRNIFSALSIASGLIVISLFLTGTLSRTSLHLFVVPASFMLAYVLKDYKKKWIPELYFWMLVFLMVMNVLFYKN